MVHKINLPVGTINTIINIDDPRVLVPINEAAELFGMDSAKPPVIRSMYSMPEITEKIVNFKSDVSYISHIYKDEITKQPENVKYFKIHVKYFPSEKEVDLIVPSYVKLFSRGAKSYVPAEFIRKSDILVDYTGYYVQVFDNAELSTEEFSPKEYYHIDLTTNNNQYLITFYFEGIFASIANVNFGGIITQEYEK